MSLYEPFSGENYGQTALVGSNQQQTKFYSMWPECEFSETDCYNLFESEIFCFSLQLILTLYVAMWSYCFQCC